MPYKSHWPSSPTKREAERHLPSLLLGFMATIVLAACGASGSSTSLPQSSPASAPQTIVSTPVGALSTITPKPTIATNAIVKSNFGRPKTLSSVRKPQISLYTGTPYGCPFEMADFVTGVAGQAFSTQITPIVYDDAHPNGPGTLTYSFMTPLVAGWTPWPPSWNGMIQPSQPPYPMPVTVVGDIPVLTPNGVYVAIMFKTPEAPDIANPQDCKPIVVTVASPSPSPSPIPLATPTPRPTPSQAPPPSIAKQTIVVTKLSEPYIDLTDAANSTFGTLTWKVSGNVAPFNTMMFSSATTTAPPHRNRFQFKVPFNTAPGDYQVGIYVIPENGLTSATSTATVRVLPPVGFATDINPIGVFELDQNGNIEQADANPVAKTAAANTMPDFGVPSLSTTTTTSSLIRHTKAVVHGPYDPHNPTSGVVTEIDSFKQLKNVGCVWVVNYDNVLHDPTRGTQVAQGTYQIFAYCTPTGILQFAEVYPFVYTTVGHDLNTQAETRAFPVNGACLNSTDLVDGLFLCRTTNVINIKPVTGHAEFFSIDLVYEGAPQFTFDKVTFPRIPVNSKGVIYPKVDASSLRYVGTDQIEPGVIPFPKIAYTSVNPEMGIHFCKDLGSKAELGCVSRDSAADLLRKALIGIYTPPKYDVNSRYYTPHHIQPVCWGGNNDSVNGVFLVAKGDPQKLHTQFTSWWDTDNFSLAGTLQSPSGDGDC